MARRRRSRPRRQSSQERHSGYRRRTRSCRQSGFEPNVINQSINRHQSASTDLFSHQRGSNEAFIVRRPRHCHLLALREYAAQTAKSMFSTVLWNAASRKALWGPRCGTGLDRVFSTKRGTQSSTTPPRVPIAIVRSSREMNTQTARHRPKLHSRTTLSCQLWSGLTRKQGVKERPSGYPPGLARRVTAEFILSPCTTVRIVGRSKW